MICIVLVTEQWKTGNRSFSTLWRLKMVVVKIESTAFFAITWAKQGIHRGLKVDIYQW